MEDTKNVMGAAGHYVADVIQFLMPYGQRRYTSTELPMETRDAYEDMIKHGLRFEAEMLQTGEVSITISDPKNEKDVDISITSNGPDVQRGMIEMLKRGEWHNPQNDV